MNNDKFVNYYVELLTSTLHDALGKNLVFQTQQRISNEEKDQFESVINELKNKNEEIFDLTSKRDDHIETFKSELIAARSEITQLKLSKQSIISEYEEQIKKLKEQIEYLNLTPIQRKKFDKNSQKGVNDGGEF